MSATASTYSVTHLKHAPGVSILGSLPKGQNAELLTLEFQKGKLSVLAVEGQVKRTDLRGTPHGKKLVETLDS